ncbi:MAG: hypothetical protein EXR98_05440 [Gemmataceae bacterium]|nr:hypothetical protein [Gemmataceae bacterium]
MKLQDHLAEMVRRRNRELAFDAILKAGLGVVFSFFTFGFVFWFAWFVGFFFGRQMNLVPWQFAGMFTGVFFVAATWSAWRRIDPLAGLALLSDREWFLTMLSQAAGGLGYFSPRHASAGFAVVLIGGPAGVMEAIGIWAHRIRADAGLIDDAARLLDRCESVVPIGQVRNLTAAFLLHRLALVKLVPHGDQSALTLTDKGLAVVSNGKGGREKG